MKEKTKQTNLDKFGFEYGLSSPIVQEKRRQTNQERYGVDNQFQRQDIIEDIGKKRIETYYKNGTGPASKQQIHIHSLVGGELNLPIGTLMLDIAFPEEKVYIEYDGGGHDLPVKLNQITRKEFNTKQVKRDTFLKSKDWKLIRITSPKDVLLDDNILIKLIQESKEFLLSNGNSWIEIDIYNNKIKSSSFVREIDVD